MPVEGGTTENRPNACCPQRRNWYRSRLRSYSSSVLRATASGRPNTSTCTEWSITRSAGMSGSSRAGSPPRSATAWRMAASVAASPGPAGDGHDVVVGDAHPVVVAQQVLEQHLHRVRQAADVVTEG